MIDPLDLFSKENSNTTQMIEEIKMHECLWDLSNPEYYTRESRTAAWEDICGMLCPNYADMDYRDKTEFDYSLKRKWKSLKDCFRREVKKLKKNPKKLGRYKYFKKMEFLLKNSKDCSCVETPDGESPMKTEVLDDEFLDFGMAEESKSAKRKRSSISTTPEKKETPTSAPKRSSRIRNKKSKRKSSPEPVNVLEHSQPDIKPMFLQAVPPIIEPIPEDDEDRLFLLSLIKDLKKIPEDYKLEAKCEIMKVVRKFKMVAQTQYTIDSSFSYEPVRRNRRSKPQPAQESEDSSDSYVVEEYLDEDEDFEIDLVKKKNIKSEKLP